MTQKKLIENLANVQGITKAEARRQFNAFVDVCTSAVKKGEEIPIKGLGKINVVDLPARTSYMPLQGKRIQVPARKAVRFRPSRKIQELLNS
jgi:DNA-binding protein HU-beta